MLRPALRLLLGLALVALAVLEAQSLLATFRALDERRAEVGRQVRQTVLEALQAAQELYQQRGARAVAERLRRRLPVAETQAVEILGPSGAVLAAEPGALPIGHALSAAQQRALAAGEVVVVGPLPTAGGALLLTYVDLPRTGARVRVASRVPELAAEAVGRRGELARHGAVLLVLLLALLQALLPARTSPARPAHHDPYEEALTRLQRQGEERRKELQRLRDLVADREAMARAGELSAGMAHELRNGLGTILGHARLLEQDPASARASAAGIREECAALEHVVKRFSEFVRRERLQVARFDLRRMVERVLARESQGGNGRTRATLVPGPSVACLGDEDLVERAVENLVRNAREAAGDEGVIVVAVAKDDGHARVTVSDDGPGLTAEVRARLGPFFTTKPGGLGLGLALVAKIAGLHGGRLELLDREPRGLVAALILGDADVTDGSVT